MVDADLDLAGWCFVMVEEASWDRYLADAVEVHRDRFVLFLVPICMKISDGCE